MKQKRIMLGTVEDAKDFVAAATKCEFDIDVFYNRVVIDAIRRYEPRFDQSIDSRI
jgi:phosphocarrier protein HPr